MPKKSQNIPLVRDVLPIGGSLCTRPVVLLEDKTQGRQHEAGLCRILRSKNCISIEELKFAILSANQIAGNASFFVGFIPSIRSEHTRSVPAGTT
jgi:hypothetical protein